MRTIHRVLVGCGGGLGTQLVRAVEGAGLEAVAIYRARAARAPYVHEAAWAVQVEEESDPIALLNAGLDAGADAVLPGGPLAASSDLARMVENVGMAWIGPRADHLQALRDPTSARTRARDAGMEVVPASPPLSTLEDVATWLHRLGAPVHIRGSSRGSAARWFDDPVAAQAWAEAEGPWPCVVERAVPDARRLTFVVLGDGQGNAIHLGDYESTVSDGAGGHLRESPSGALDTAARSDVGNRVADVCASFAWAGVCGVEVLVGADGRAWCADVDPSFPPGIGLVELAWGVEVVHGAITLAAGEELGWEQADITPRAAAVELVLRATAAGTIRAFRGLGRSVSVPLVTRGQAVDADEPLAVLRVKAPTRQAALVRLRALVEAVVVEGVPTNRPALRALFDRRDVWDGQVAFRADGRW